MSKTSNAKQDDNVKTTRQKRRGRPPKNKSGGLKGNSDKNPSKQGTTIKKGKRTKAQRKREAKLLAQNAKTTDVLKFFKSSEKGVSKDSISDLNDSESRNAYNNNTKLARVSNPELGSSNLQQMSLGKEDYSDQMFRDSLLEPIEEIERAPRSRLKRLSQLENKLLKNNQSDDSNLIMILLHNQKILEKKIDTIGMMMLSMQKRHVPKDKKRRIDEMLKTGYSEKTSDLLRENMMRDSGFFERPRKNSIQKDESSLLNFNLGSSKQ